MILGPDGCRAACRWTGIRCTRLESGFEALRPGAAPGGIGDLGVHDPVRGTFRLPARWGAATATIDDVIDRGSDFDVLAGEIVVDRGLVVPTELG